MNHLQVITSTSGRPVAEVTACFWEAQRGALAPWWAGMAWGSAGVMQLEQRCETMPEPMQKTPLGSWMCSRAFEDVKRSWCVFKPSLEQRPCPKEHHSSKEGSGGRSLPILAVWGPCGAAPLLGLGTEPMAAAATAQPSQLASHLTPKQLQRNLA